MLWRNSRASRTLLLDDMAQCFNLTHVRPCRNFVASPRRRSSKSSSSSPSSRCPPCLVWCMSWWRWGCARYTGRGSMLNLRHCSLSTRRDQRSKLTMRPRLIYWRDECERTSSEQLIFGFLLMWLRHRFRWGLLQPCVMPEASLVSASESFVGERWRQRRGCVGSDFFSWRLIRGETHAHCCGRL